MNIKQLKDLIADLPDYALVYQETGDHELASVRIDKSYTYEDPDYGTIEAYGIPVQEQPCLIIR